MKNFFATAALLALSCSSYGQLADMIEIPEEMGEEGRRYTDEELLQSWGWLLAERFNLQGLQISPSEIDQISEGMIAHVQGKKPPTDLEKSMLVIQEYFTKREQQIVKQQLATNKAKEREFFDALFGMPDVKQLGSGLYYQIITPGNATHPKPTDHVIVRYEGRFLDNTVFDSTEGRDPVAFKLNEVIPGWTQGLPLIGEGGKIKLYVPAKLGYGDEPRPSIPPGSPLVFEIELIKVGLPENGEAATAEPGPAAPAEAAEAPEETDSAPAQ